MQQTLEHTLLQVLEEPALAHQIDIVCIEVVGPKKAPIVRVRIDYLEPRDTTIGLDELCEHTTWISEVLDTQDVIKDSYTLEVSSPGLSRPLTKLAHFVRFAQHEISLELAAGVHPELPRRLTAYLEGVQDEAVVCTFEEHTLSLSLDDMKSCKLKPDYSALQKHPN